MRASSETPQRRCRWRPASTAGLQSLSSAIPRDAPTRTRPLSPAQDLETGIQVGFNGLVVERELVGTHIRFKAKETDSMVRSRPQHACPRCPVLIPAPVVAGAKGEAPAAANGEVAVLLEAAFEVAPQADTLGVANGDAEAHADPKQPPPGAAVEVNGEAPAGAAPNGLVAGAPVHGALCTGAAPNGLAPHGVGLEVNREATDEVAPNGGVPVQGAVCATAAANGLAPPGTCVEVNGDAPEGAAPNGLAAGVAVHGALCTGAAPNGLAPHGVGVEVNGEAPAGAAPNGLVEGVAVHGALCVGAAPNGLAAHGVGVEVNGEAPAWPAPKGLAAPGVTLELNGDVVAGAAPNGDATAPEDDM